MGTLESYEKSDWFNIIINFSFTKLYTVRRFRLNFLENDIKNMNNKRRLRRKTTWF